MYYIKELSNSFLHALKNLLPIVAVVLLFQLLILQQIPDNSLAMAGGLLIVAVGVALLSYGDFWCMGR